MRTTLAYFRTEFEGPTVGTLLARSFDFQRRPDDAMVRVPRTTVRLQTPDHVLPGIFFLHLFSFRTFFITAADEILGTVPYEDSPWILFRGQFSKFVDRFFTIFSSKRFMEKYSTARISYWLSTFKKRNREAAPIVTFLRRKFAIGARSGKFCILPTNGARSGSSPSTAQFDCTAHYPMKANPATFRKK
jgi:hypothetical protein